jgi:hypothetical protein
VPNKRIDLTGTRFGRWTVLAYARDSKWSCVCDCGTRVVVRESHLRDGCSRSCGCLARELRSIRSKKHGMSRSREYKAWAAMKQRCSNPRNASYENYGGRGISFCEEWHSFEAFFADKGECPEGYSLDRIDPNGNYEPSNCRWADNKQQAQNRRRPRASAAVKRRRLEQTERLPPSLEDPPF